MAQATTLDRSSTQEINGLSLHYLSEGAGQPAVVVHQDIGSQGWTPFLERLSHDHQVIAPDLPGWGQSERAPWMRSVRDLAVTLHHLEDALGLDDILLVGLGLGGWVAAEMVTMDQRRYTGLVLVGAAGLQPDEGEILDQFLFSYDEYARRGFSSREAHDAVFGAEPETDVLVGWDISREMVARVAWKPYMFSQTLPHLLAEVRVPSLIAWGTNDAIVPMSVARGYANVLPNATLELVNGAGHFVELEQSEALAERIVRFARESAATGGGR